MDPTPRVGGALKSSPPAPASTTASSSTTVTKAYPDPRSLWQPNGVHGLSRVYDNAAFPWKHSPFQPPPLPSAILYELHVGTFTPKGTLDAAIARLEYLRDLGVTHVELMPVAAFAGSHGWGYDGVALYAVHQPYGGPDALKRFVDAAHGLGLAVLLDVVYNHFGPVGNYTGIFAPYLDDAHKTPWGGAVNLESAWSHQVRRFFCDNALMWMRDFHIDGLRLDAVHAFVDRSAIHFLEQLATETRALEAVLGRRLVLIAESDLNDPRLVTAQDAGGFGLDAQWSDDFHHALFTLLARQPQTGYYADFGGMDQLKKSLETTYVYDGIYSRYRQRVHGRPASHLPQDRFLGYIQNHDQVGNRALGDRLQVSSGIDRAKIAAALVITSPFIPMIFQGEEWAASTPFLYFADPEDPEIAKLISQGRKNEFAAFGWDPDSIPDPREAGHISPFPAELGRITGRRSRIDAALVQRPDPPAPIASLPQLRISRPDPCRMRPGEKMAEHDARRHYGSVQPRKRAARLLSLIRLVCPSRLSRGNRAIRHANPAAA